MADFSILEPNKTPEIQFSDDPAYNLIASACLLNEENMGFPEWITGTRAKLTSGQKKANKSICMAFMFMYGKSWSGLHEWISFFEKLDPAKMRIEQAEHLINKAERSFPEDKNIPSVEDLIEDKKTFMNLYKNLGKYKNDICTEDEYEEKYETFIDPVGLKRDILSNIKIFWKEYLKSEWENSKGVIAESVKAFKTLDLRNLSLNEIFTKVTERRQIPEQWAYLFDTAEKVIFIPSTHIGPYLLADYSEKVVRIICRARIPEGVKIDSPILNRSEILMRLSALGDDTRLNILKTVADKGTITSQEIIDNMNLSQSSASRHLGQLTANGYLLIQSGERTKRYTLNFERIEHTFSGLKKFLSPGNNQ